MKPARNRCLPEGVAQTAAFAVCGFSLRVDGENRGPQKRRSALPCYSRPSTAEVLKVSPETVMRDWKLAKGWLLSELRG